MKYAIHHYYRYTMFIVHEFFHPQVPRVKPKDVWALINKKK